MNKVLEITGKSPSKKSLDDILKEGTERIFQQALEIEIEEFIERYSYLRTDTGKKRIVRNGYHKERAFQTKAGNMRIRIPRARDKSEFEDKIQYSSRLIPPYLRRSRDINEFIPFLYLKGISTGDFSEVLTELLG